MDVGEFQISPLVRVPDQLALHRLRRVRGALHLEPVRVGGRAGHGRVDPLCVRRFTYVYHDHGLAPHVTVGCGNVTVPDGRCRVNEYRPGAVFSTRISFLIFFPRFKRIKSPQKRATAHP